MPRPRIVEGALDAAPGQAFSDAMTKTFRPKPATTPQSESARDARLEREAAALRENLRRRKEQVRARVEPTKPEPAD